MRPLLPKRTSFILASLLLSCVTLALVFPVHTAFANTDITRVSFTKRSDNNGFVIRLHASERIRGFQDPRLTKANRLELTLFNTKLARNYLNDQPKGPVKRYDTVKQSKHLILQFELDPRQPVQASAYRDRGSNDLLIGLTFTSAPPITAPEVLPVANHAVKPEHTPEKRASAQANVHRKLMLDTIVIDAGHGGKDPGAVANGLREKDVALSVALKVGKYIEEKLGVNVIYTRKDDRFIDLMERGRIANEAGGKLFISIHANAVNDGRARGTETFFLGMHKSKAAKDVMERENGVINLEDNPEQYRVFSEEKLILQSMAQSAFMRKSEQLAAVIEDQFANRVNRKSRGVKQAGFLVLWAASMPSVLVELGFITNRKEAAFLKSQQGQDYMASAIFRAVRAYKQQYDEELHLAASTE